MNGTLEMAVVEEVKRGQVMGLRWPGDTFFQTSDHETLRPYDFSQNT
jgi:hypothetical protein